MFSCLSVCLCVCLYPINVKTTEQIGRKFCVEPHMTPRKVYEWSKFQKFASIKIGFSKNSKSTKIYFKIRELNCFFSYKLQWSKRKIFNRRWTQPIKLNTRKELRLTFFFNELQDFKFNSKFVFNSQKPRCCWKHISF